ncbi:hypothetical protein V2J09_015092 [Rumex salicifolius]
MWKLQPTTETLKHHHHHHHHHPLFNFCSGERSATAAVQTYASSRWCPTPEQLRALEEFYKRGIRTPSTYQIQQITAQLRRYGKIEGKNVFYWFQNHKARERQRMRRRLSLGSSALLSEPKSSKDLQVVRNKSWATKECVAVARPGNTAEVEKDRWIHQLLIDTQIKQNSSLENNNNGISPSRQSHVTLHSNLMLKSNNSCVTINEDHNSCIDCQFETPKISTRRPNKTLELFPLRGDEKANDEDSVQFYEFL